MKNKLIIFLFICITLFSISSIKVQAVTARETITEEGYSYFYCEKQPEDISVDYYTYKYRTYNDGGLQTGTFNISKSIIDGSNKYLVRCKGNGQLEMYVSSSNFYFSYFGTYNEYYIGYGQYKGYKGEVYNYNTENNSFELSASYPNDTKIYFTVNEIRYFTSGVLLTNSDIQFYFNGFSSATSFQYLKDNLVLKTPILKSGDGFFRLYLQDYYDKSITLTDHQTVTTTLKNVYLYVYDFIEGSYLVQRLDMLTNADVQEDSEGNYYIDINEEYCKLLKYRDGDYLISFITMMQSNLVYTNNGSSFTSMKVYNDLSYFRYKYFASSGVGILVPSDENGNEIGGGSGDNDSDEEDNKTADAIKEQTEKIEEQTGAIKEQTEKIEEQTNAIKEQNETQKNIFQKIIELPRYYCWLVS